MKSRKQSDVFQILNTHTSFGYRRKSEMGEFILGKIPLMPLDVNEHRDVDATGVGSFDLIADGCSGRSSS